MPQVRPSAAIRAKGRKVADQEFRIAAIDVGSNSIHMVIAQADADGGLTTLWRLKEMVGLGRISFPSKRLTYHAMDRAVETLRRFQEEAKRRQCERIVAVATSAVREAENGGDFVQRTRRELGLHVRVISARDEARLIYLGVRHEMQLKGGPHLIFDVGGGSVEFIVGDAEKPLMLESRKLGAARMTAKFVKSDPIDGDELKALLSHYEQELAPIVEGIKGHRIAAVVGTSGTIETLAAMCGEEEGSNGDTTCYISASALAKLVSDLLECRSKDRARMKGLDDDRKDQILAGALLVNRLMQLLDIKRMQVCGSALREGLLMDFLARHRPELQIRREVPDPRRRSVIDLARRCNWQQAHSEQVAKLCVRLFDQTKAIHGLGRPQRELIEYGALLHDIGWLVGRKKHHKHSRYLILNGQLDPFTSREVKVMGNITRYHRKAFPKTSHRCYRKLREKDRKIVRVGAALLRIADGLDRSSSAVITDLRCRIGERKVDIVVKAKGDAELEIWSARSRSRLFAKVFERTVGCQQE
jgi:exopolyphosphatase/guanosine-5'-triphosphate,3'-diphosphate pyrophosphatase